MIAPACVAQREEALELTGKALRLLEGVTPDEHMANVRMPKAGLWFDQMYFAGAVHQSHAAIGHCGRKE